MLSSLGLCTKDKLTSYNEKKITSITAQIVVHLEDFMVNLSRYKLSPINYKLQHQLVWSAPEWMDRKRHSRDFSPRATLFRYCLTWFRLKEKDYKVVTTVISSFQNERQASHFKFNIFHRWALNLSSSLGNSVTWANWYEGRGHLTEKTVHVYLILDLIGKSVSWNFLITSERRCGQVED